MRALSVRSTGIGHMSFGLPVPGHSPWVWPVDCRGDPNTLYKYAWESVGTCSSLSWLYGIGYGIETKRPHCSVRSKQGIGYGIEIKRPHCSVRSKQARSHKRSQSQEISLFSDSYKWYLCPGNEQNHMWLHSLHSLPLRIMTTKISVKYNITKRGRRDNWYTYCYCDSKQHVHW